MASAALDRRFGDGAQRWQFRNSEHYEASLPVWEGKCSVVALHGVALHGAVGEVGCPTTDPRLRQDATLILVKATVRD